MRDEDVVKYENNMPFKNPKWNFWQALYLILIVYIIVFVLGFLRPPSNLGSLEGYLNYLKVGFGEGLMFFLALIVFFKLIRRPLTDLGLVNLGLKNILIGLAGGIVLFLSVGLLGNLLVEYLGVPDPQSFALVISGANSTWQLAVLLLLGGIIVPLKEELVFRGLIYPPLRKGYGKTGGILLTAMFFGILHFDLIRFLPLLLGGVVLTLIYERTQSLWSSIIAHGTWNSLMILLMWWQKG